MSYGIGTFGADDPNDRKFRKFSDRELVKALLHYILTYKRDFSIVIGSLLITASIGVAGPSLLGSSLNDIVSKNFTGLVYLIAIFASLSFVGYYAESKRTYHIQLLGQNVIYDIRRDAFGKLQQLPLRTYSKRETGRIMSYITNDVDAVSDFVTFPVARGSVRRSFDCFNHNHNVSLQCQSLARLSHCHSSFGGSYNGDAEEDPDSASLRRERRSQ